MKGKLTEVLGAFEEVYALLFLCPGLGSLLWEFISVTNPSQSVREKARVDVSQVFISFSPFRSGMSRFDNIQFPLVVKDTTFLWFYLVGFLFMVCSLSRIRAERSRDLPQSWKILSDVGCERTEAKP